MLERATLAEHRNSSVSATAARFGFRSSSRRPAQRHQKAWKEIGAGSNHLEEISYFSSKKGLYLDEVSRIALRLARIALSHRTQPSPSHSQKISMTTLPLATTKFRPNVAKQAAAAAVGSTSGAAK